MRISHHADQRMNQRGISRRLMDFTLRHGRVEGGKRVLDRKESRRIIESLNEELRLARKRWTRAASPSIHSAAICAPRSDSHLATG